VTRRACVPSLLLLLVAASGRAAAQDPPVAPPPGEADATAPPDSAAEGRQNAAVRAAVNGLVQEGNRRRQEGRLPLALEAYRSAATLDPTRYEIRILVADTLRRLGRSDEAMETYR
jgi:tetratricopeptide (TPR) repeat protein